MMSKPKGLTKFADRNVLGLQPIQVEVVRLVVSG